jgi:iron complex outermembrane receptor protein
MKMTPCVLALIAGTATPAFAQDTASGWTDTITVTGQRKAYAVPDTASATRTDTPVIQIPQSVQTLTRALLQEQDRRTLGEALVNVSGVTPTRPDEILFIPPILRGFPGEVYLDGLPIFAGNQQAYDPPA